MQVSIEADRVKELLHVQSKLALVTQQTQLDATQGAEHLADAMNQLTAMTYSELQSINETAVTLKQNLMSNNGLYYWLSSPAVYALFKRVLKSTLLLTAS